MARVQRGNVVLRVKDEDVKHYLLLGYNLTKDNGEIITAAMPNDLATLQKMHLDNQAKIAELEDTIAKLTAELTEYKRAENATTKTPTKKIYQERKPLGG
jgi:hypothetical protein